MQVGIIGLCDDGAPIVRRLLAAGHRCVVFDTSQRLVAELGAECAFGAASLRDLANELDAPRAIVLTGPASSFDITIGELLPFLEPEDIIVVRGTEGRRDSGRCERLAAAGVHYVDIDIGGDQTAMRSLEPVLALIAPSAAAASSGTVRGLPRE